jgi:hypothetical protein
LPGHRQRALISESGARSSERVSSPPERVTTPAERPTTLLGRSGTVRATVPRCLSRALRGGGTVPPPPLRERRLAPSMGARRPFSWLVRLPRLGRRLRVASVEIDKRRDLLANGGVALADRPGALARREAQHPTSPGEEHRGQRSAHLEQEQVREMMHCRQPHGHMSRRSLSAGSACWVSSFRVDDVRL